MEGMSKKLTADAKAEEDLFDKYGCWAKTIIDEKTASNEAANDRIESLEAYIADIEAGKIEFTTERIDLEKQIAALEAEIEEAGNLRDKEKEDYEAAKDEMEKAIAALEKAVEVLEEVQTGAGNLLSVKFDIRQVMEVGANILSKSDLTYMEHLLDGEVPDVDWKKLNRKATFKGKYSSRSKKINSIMKDMLQTFKDNLAEAVKKEEETQDSYEKLMKSKKDELETAQTALTDASQEGAARGLNKNEAQAEVDDLKAQVEADEGYIADTKKALKEKTKEFEERKKLRMGEIGAISEAISILSSDAARDTMKKSFSSQGYLLLQTSRRDDKAKISQRQAVMHKAFVAVRKLGEQVSDAQLSVLALKVLIRSKSKIPDALKEVVEAIDKMVERLKKDEEDDLKQKEDCEQSRMDKTKEARELSLAVDDASDAITRQEQKVEEQKVQIKIAKEEIDKLKAELKEATRTREDEKMAFESDKSDDEAAVELIGQAMDVLKSFYSENFGFVQVAKKGKQQAPGEAPPPPPSTFEGGYEGAKASKGIQSMLEMIKEDMEKDIRQAEQEEEDSQKAFAEMKEDIMKSMESLEGDISDAEGVIADAEGEIENQKEIKTTKFESLEATMTEVKEAEPGCNYIAVNFNIRIKNRQVEIDGLLKARAILQGADFR